MCSGKLSKQGKSTTILLSIKPEFVDMIFSGEKLYEYRKNQFNSENIEKVIIYCTMPIGKIVGEFSVEDILIDTPCEVWNQTNGFSGISKLFFDTYYCDRKTAVAIKIAKLIKYEVPFDPRDVMDDFCPPQSFIYLNEHALNSCSNPGFHQSTAIGINPGR